MSEQRHEHPHDHDPPEPGEEAIRQRAYEISQRADGGSPPENWRRAKEELREEAWRAREQEHGR
jgi:hypothetical protein